MIEAVPPNRAVDPAKWAFDIGCHLLALYGHGGRPARTIVARWLKRADAPMKLIDILVRAGMAERGDFKAWVEAALNPGHEPDQLTDAAIDALLAFRCANLQRAGLLHLLTPDDERRAREKGYLPPA